jgi:hypothetical protein
MGPSHYRTASANDGKNDIGTIGCLLMCIDDGVISGGIFCRFERDWAPGCPKTGRWSLTACQSRPETDPRLLDVWIISLKFDSRLLFHSNFILFVTLQCDGTLITYSYGGLPSPS